MTRSPRILVALSWFWLTLSPAPGNAQQTPAELARFLSKEIGLDAGQIAAMEKGEPVASVVDTKKKEDVAVFGIATLAITRKEYLTRVRDFKQSLRTPTRTALGIFSDPASAADVRAVVIDSEDVKDLKDCKAGDCDFKMPAAAMDDLRRKIDWNSPDVGAKINAFARERMVRYVTDYRARGDAAMIVYDDQGSTRASEAFGELLAQSPYVYKYVPALHRYLTGYPREKLEGVENVIFWAVDSIPRLRPILHVTHLALYSPPDVPNMSFLAAKQIFANHYFEALFNLVTVIDRPASSGAPGIYLVVIRRFRFDKMPSAAMVSLKGQVEGKFKDQMLEDLKSEKARLKPTKSKE